MSVFLNTLGQTSLAVAVCDRCKMKRMLVELGPDPNIPGLRVCKDRGCADELDPWRLPVRAEDRITLQYPRPEEPLEP